MLCGTGRGKSECHGWGWVLIALHTVGHGSAGNAQGLWQSGFGQRSPRSVRSGTNLSDCSSGEQCHPEPHTSWIWGRFSAISEVQTKRAHLSERTHIRKQIWAVFLASLRAWQPGALEERPGDNLQEAVAEKWSFPSIFSLTLQAHLDCAFWCFSQSWKHLDNVNCETKTGNCINAFLTKSFLFQFHSISESHHFHGWYQGSHFSGAAQDHWNTTNIQYRAQNT